MLVPSTTIPYIAIRTTRFEMAEHGNDPVGYKKPPVKTRFQPGRSGNPSGRPKTQPSFRAALVAELAATMPAKNQQQA